MNNIQCSNFPNAIFIRVAESISRINRLFSIILNSYLRILPHIFYELYSSRSACYAGLCSLLYIIWSRSVNNIQLVHLVGIVLSRTVNNLTEVKHNPGIYKKRFSSANITMHIYHVYLFLSFFLYFSFFFRFFSFFSNLIQNPESRVQNPEARVQGPVGFILCPFGQISSCRANNKSFFKWIKKKIN